MPNNELSPEVSGQAAFCILASLAAAVVVVPSTSVKLGGRSLFRAKFDIVRCIPGICLLDTIIDIVYLRCRVRKARTEPEPERFPRDPKRIAARLLLGVFVVIPQTINAFRLQGVPGTQFCAFVFAFGFVTRLLMELCGLEEEGPYTPQEEQNSQAEQNNQNNQTGQNNQTDPLVLVSAFFQAPFEIWIWYSISSSMGNVKVSYDNCLFWFTVSMFCSVSICLQALIWLPFVIIRRRFDTSNAPHIVPIAFLWVVLMAVSLADPREISRTNHFTQALTLVLLAGLSSIAVGKTLDSIIKFFSPSRTKDATTQTETKSVDDKEWLKEDGREEPSSSAPRGSWVGRLGADIDDWFSQCITLNSATSVSMTLTAFNLITTVMYYLVYFDGTGTVNPGWTSVLG
ncbi:hypothetical protein NW768_006740 [Fusarium equiseti]|uniref:Uncharacterized protein n=1 Tax=Fusarium equiseti TaxID=61235 RepID=A0ABQ8R9C0_FUSEQ|nr:hypothetical protein NW768_006740 [Fusarium equiseti]